MSLFIGGITFFGFVIMSAAIIHQTWTYAIWTERLRLQNERQFLEWKLITLKWQQKEEERYVQKSPKGKSKTEARDNGTERIGKDL